MAVMNLQNDGKQVMRLCNQFVQEWVPSVSAGAGVKHDLMIYTGILPDQLKVAKFWSTCISTLLHVSFLCA